MPPSTTPATRSTWVARLPPCACQSLASSTACTRTGRARPASGITASRVSPKRSRRPWEAGTHSSGTGLELCLLRRRGGVGRRSGRTAKLGVDRIVYVYSHLSPVPGVGNMIPFLTETCCHVVCDAGARRGVCFEVDQGQLGLRKMSRLSLCSRPRCLRVGPHPLGFHSVVCLVTNLHLLPS